MERQANTSDGKAKKHLIELYCIDNKKRFPNFPDYARVTPKYTDKTANGLTKCIIDFINYSGGHAERINCTGRVLDQRETVSDCIGNQKTVGSLKYIRTAGQRGTADISATFNGRSIKIEVKIGNDRQSPAQRLYEAQVVSSGGIYFIAKNFTQFHAWFTSLFMEGGK